MPVDAKRRLVLLRRDSTDHLVLLGSGPDLLLEGGIPAPAETEIPAVDKGGRGEAGATLDPPRRRRGRAPPSC